MQIKNIGYNNNSGTIYRSCGMNQYKRRALPVDDGDTGMYENKKNVSVLLNRMNDTDKTASKKEIVSTEKRLEIKSDPNMGDAQFSISKGEQMAQKISSNSLKQNYPAQSNRVETNIKLK